MTETKFTPGPWEFHRSIEKYDGEYDYAISSPSTLVLAEAFGRDAEGGFPHAEANASLIAAAPDMFEALRPFAAVAEHDIGADEADADLFRPIRNNHAPLLTVGDLRRAVAALSKALGMEGA